MTRKMLGGLVGSALSLVIACAAGGVLLLGGGVSATCTAPLPSGAAPISPPAGGWQPVGRFDGEQVGHAATIASVGAQMGVPARGWIIAVATAIQESALRNLSGGDRDSIGLFQQRPSQGWGEPKQLRDPVYAAGKFYEKLLTVANWQQIPLTEAAQAVQRSAYPDAYAKHEPDATLLVKAVSGLIDASGAPLLDCGAATGPWTQPVMAPIWSGFRTAERPSHDGVDLGAPQQTRIRAASAGIVTVVRCNAIDVRDDSDWGCDRPGDPDLTKGCGWYVDIEHDGGIVTRYCHMLTRPFVHEGQSVGVGQVIGVVGSTGHSSAPHLHFEVHSSGTATDPVPFMAEHAAPLGQP
ncbi:M23 family metallopeptidase [Actinomycetes bacterium KLBMP 9797]